MINDHVVELTQQEFKEVFNGRLNLYHKYIPKKVRNLIKPFKGKTLSGGYVKLKLEWERFNLQDLLSEEEYESYQSELKELYKKYDLPLKRHVHIWVLRKTDKKGTRDRWEQLSNKLYSNFISRHFNNDRIMAYLGTKEPLKVSITRNEKDGYCQIVKDDQIFWSDTPYTVFKAYLRYLEAKWYQKKN